MKLIIIRHGETPENATDEKKDKPTPLTIDQSADSMKQSFLVELGDRVTLTKKYESLKANTEEAQLKIYSEHFGFVPIAMQIYKLMPGIEPANPRTARGFYFVKHNDQAVSTGYLVVPMSGDWSMPIGSIRLEQNGGMAFSLDAESFIDRIVGSVIYGNNSENPKLQSVLPLEGDEESQALTACKTVGEGENATVVIEGSLAKESGSVNFVVEESLQEGGDPDLYRPLYRVEMSYDDQISDGSEKPQE